jgi:metallo-beta-lactamase family protein
MRDGAASGARPCDDPPMQLQFLGGATTVTGSRFLLTTSRARVLVDCGMFQGSPNETIRNRIPLGFDPNGLDGILLTHAHLDHCGLLPVAVREGYRGPIWATAGTIELARLVLLDSGRLHEEFAKREARWEKRNPDKAVADDAKELADYQKVLAERDMAGEGGTTAGAATQTTAAAADPAANASAGGEEAAAVETANPAGSTAAAPGAMDPEEDLRRQPPELLVDLDAPLYTEDDAKATLPQFREARYEEEFEVAPGVHATYHDAGHILGSAIIRLRVRDAEDDEDRFLVFSGDLGRPGTPIIRDPTSLVHADYVVVESTYGGREHEPQDEAVRILAETIRLVDEQQGVLLVPSFAIGRTQEIVWQLDRLIEAGEIPLLPLYLDSPMASKATEVYRHHTDYYDAETRELLQTEGSPLDYPNQTIVNDAKDSRQLQYADRPYLIVASNGMLTGGRVVNHLRNLVGDPKATILFVGYQGVGTLGAHLQAGAKEIRLDGETRAVRCQVRSISGFSAHADENELLEWLGNFRAGKEPGDPGFPRRVFLVHGDPEAQIALAPKVEALGFATRIPKWQEAVTLE